MAKRSIPVIACALVIWALAGCAKKEDPAIAELNARLQAMEAELEKAKSSGASAEEIAKLENAITETAGQEAAAPGTAVAKLDEAWRLMESGKAAQVLDMVNVMELQEIIPFAQSVYTANILKPEEVMRLSEIMTVKGSGITANYNEPTREKYDQAVMAILMAEEMMAAVKTAQTRAASAATAAPAATPSATTARTTAAAPAAPASTHAAAAPRTGFQMQGEWLTKYTGSDKNVIIPSGITAVSGSAFGGNTNITSITIPASVHPFGTNLFIGCSSLAAINVDAANPDLSSQDGVLYNKSKSSLIAYPAGKTGSAFAIPNSVTAIADDAFNGCANLTSVTIPSSVTIIGSGAFMGCTGLKSITIPDGVTHPGGSIFKDCTSLASVTLPGTLKIIQSGAFKGCTSLTGITIPNEVIHIYGGAFVGTGLTSVTIPASVKYIDSGAFDLNSNLTRVTFEGMPQEKDFNKNAFTGNLHTVIFNHGFYSGKPGTFETEEPAPVRYGAKWKRVSF